MSKKTPKQTLPLPLTGADHRLIALLRHIAGNETAGHWGYDELAPYISAARQVVHSKNAFDGAIETLSIHGYVFKSERFASPNRGGEGDKAMYRAIQQIIDAKEGETVTADAWDLFSFVNGAVAEAQLYGAAVMFELLEGRAR